MRKIVKKICHFLKEHVDDMLIFSGLGVLVATTFLINTIAGLYTLGAVLFLLGIFFAITSSRRRG